MRKVSCLVLGFMLAVLLCLGCRSSKQSTHSISRKTDVMWDTTSDSDSSRMKGAKVRSIVIKVDSMFFPPALNPDAPMPKPSLPAGSMYGVTIEVDDSSIAELDRWKNGKSAHWEEYTDDNEVQEVEKQRWSVGMWPICLVAFPILVGIYYWRHGR